MSTLIQLLRPLVLPATQVTPAKLRRGLSIPITSTKFGGRPYAESSSDWPTCGGCDQGLSFIFQCSLGDCLHQKSQGLFTFFYCHECNPWGDIPADVENAWAVYRYSNPAKDNAVELDDSSPDEVRARECSVKLEVVQSLPDWETINDLAPAIAQLSADANKEEPWSAYQAAVQELLGSEPDFATTIGGYPSWVQGADIPDCSVCNQPTRLLAQIDSEEEAGFMWGDSGLVYLFECPKHPDQVQMRLQCF